MMAFTKVGLRRARVRVGDRLRQGVALSVLLVHLWLPLPLLGRPTPRVPVPAGKGLPPLAFLHAKEVFGGGGVGSLGCVGVPGRKGESLESTP